MAKVLMPSTARDFILSIDYDPTGLEWARVFDNICLGWLVDDVDPTAPEPVILGALPPPAASTPGVMSPQWCHVSEGGVAVPDVYRGGGFDFLTWLATNGGANRKIAGSFISSNFAGVYSSWSFRFPALATP
jgi:hypothetical protein